LSSWGSNLYLRRLHQTSVVAVLLFLVALPVIFLIFFRLVDHPVFRFGGGLLAVAAVVCAVGLAPALVDPRNHDSYRALAKYGDPEGVAQALAVEMVRGGHTSLGVVIGREYLVIPSITRLDGVRRTDVMWIYPRVTTTRYYGIIPGNRRHEAVILTRHREFTLLGLTKKKVDDLLRAVHHAAPWAQVGYTDELCELFSGDRRAFAFQQIDARREGMAVAG